MCAGSSWMSLAPTSTSLGPGGDKAPLADCLDTELPCEVSSAPIGNAYMGAGNAVVEHPPPQPPKSSSLLPAVCSSSPGANSSQLTAYPRNHRNSFLGKPISICTISCCSASTAEPEREYLC